MAVTNHGDKASLSAAVDLRTKRHYLVKQTSDVAVNLCTAVTDNPLGVLDNNPNTGETASIARINSGSTFKVIAGGTILRNQEISTDANGKAIVAAGAGTVAFARALHDAVLNDIVECEGIGRRVI